MAINFKKVTATLVALTMVSTVTATTHEPEATTCNPPCAHEGWSFGAEYLWVQTTNDSLNYAGSPIFNSNPNSTPLMTARFPSISPGFNTSSGIHLQAQYDWRTR